MATKPLIFTIDEPMRKTSFTCAPMTSNCGRVVSANNATKP